MKRPPCIGGADHPVAFLGHDQNEPSLATPGDLYRPSKSRLDHIAGSIAESIEKIGHGEPATNTRFS